MPTLGDAVDLDLELPQGREAGFRHLAILVTAQRIFDAEPTVVHVVTLTTTIRRYHSEIMIEPDDVNSLDEVSAPNANRSGRSLLGGSSLSAATSGSSRSGSYAKPSR